MPERNVDPGTVKLKVLYAGICGSDVHEFFHGPMFTRAEVPHPRTGVRNPVIFGHELCGEVVDVGSGVTTVREGDLVAVSPVDTCGHCAECSKGIYGRCETMAVHGYTRDGGAFAGFTTITESMAQPLPAGFEPVHGALVEPMSVGLQAAARTRVHRDQTVAVHGGGPIGIGVLLALKAWGVRTIASDPSPERRRVLGQLGIDHVLDPTDIDPGEAIRELTNGDGADASVDAAGVQRALDASLDSTTVDGMVVQVAVPMEPLHIEVNRFRRNSTHLTASNGASPAAFRQVVELMIDGHYPVEGWTATVPFADIVPAGFEALNRQEKTKVLVDPGV